MGQTLAEQEHADLQRLQQVLAAMAAAELRVVAVGATAFSLLQNCPLPPGECAALVGWGPGEGDARETVARVGGPLAIALRWAADEGADETHTAIEICRPEIEAAPIRAWTRLLEATGTVHDPRDVTPEIDSGRLTLPFTPRTWLRTSADRVLQVATWAAWTGLVPGADIVRPAQREANHVLGLDRALWALRFGQLLVGWRASEGLRFLHQVRALQLMLPEVCAMVDFHKSCPVHHKDIWDHTLQVVDKCPGNLAVRWAALMHDTGKVWTRSVTHQGRVHFFRHEEMGASLMEGVAGRFHLDPALRDRVVYIIANHARANVYSTEWTDSAVRRLVRDMGANLDDVISFSQSDYTTKRAWRIREVRTLASELRQRIARVVEEDARVPPLPKGFGLLLMQHTGRSGGPWLGRIQRWLEDQVEQGLLEPGLDAERYLQWVQAHGPELLSAIDPPSTRSKRTLPTPS